MNFPEEIKKIRERALLTQMEFAEVVGVAFSTINRWETGKSRPHIKAMKNIKAYCEKHSLPYEDVEEAWLDHKIGK
jgi:DNA-binding protein